MLQARQNEPIVRQGQQKRCRRKHYHAPAKQDTSKQPPQDLKSHWHGNKNTQPSKTLRLRSETTRRASRSYDSHTGPTKTALADPSKNALPRRIPMAHANRDGCGRCDSGATPREHGLHPQTLTYKREPFATKLRLMPAFACHQPDACTRSVVPFALSGGEGPLQK